MNDKQKIVPYIILTVLYIILILPIMALSILLIGKADVVFVIFFGFINTIFFSRYYKGDLFLSFLLGFTVSGFSLCFLYFLWFLGFLLSFESAFPTIFFLIISIVLCIVLTKNYLKIKSQKNIHLIILPLTLIFLICSFKLKDTYPTKFENENLTFAQIKIIDKQKKPRFGDTIEVRIHRQPLFGIRGSHEIYKATTNKKGIAKIQFSKSNNYTLYISSNEDKFDSFEISSMDLKTKKVFVIEE